MAKQINLQLLVDTAGAEQNLGEAKNAVKELNKALQDPKNSAMADSLTKALGKSKAAFSDFKNEVNLLDPDKKAQAFVNLGTSITGAFTAGVGAIGLFGAKSELVEEAQKRAASAIAVLQGVQALANAKDDIAIVKKLLGWKQQTVAVNAATAAQGANAAATEAGAGAFGKLRGAIIATGLGALVVLIGTVIANWDRLKAAVQGNSEGMKKFKDALLFIAPPLGLLIKGIDMVSEKFGGFQNLLGGISESIKKVFSNIGDVFAAVASGDFSKAFDNIKNLGKGLGDAFNEGVRKSQAEQDEELRKIRVAGEIETQKRLLQVKQAGGEDSYKLQKQILNKELSLLEFGSKEYLDKMTEIRSLDAAENKKVADKAKEDYKKFAEERKGALEKLVDLQKKASEQLATDQAKTEEEKLALEIARKKKELEDAYQFAIKKGVIATDAEKIKNNALVSINEDYDIRLKGILATKEAEEKEKAKQKAEEDKAKADAAIKDALDLENRKKQALAELKLLDAETLNQEKEARLAQVQSDMEVELSQIGLLEEEKKAIIARAEEEKHKIRLEYAEKNLDMASQTVQALSNINSLASTLALKSAEGDAKKQAKIRATAAKVQKGIDIAQAVIMGTKSVMNALSSVPYPANIVAAVVAGTAAAANVAKIAATPIPGADGGGSGGGGSAGSEITKGVSTLASAAGSGGSSTPLNTASNTSTLFSDELLKKEGSNQEGSSTHRSGNPIVIQNNIVETDITSTQNRVKNIQAKATIG